MSSTRLETVTAALRTVETQDFTALAAFLAPTFVYQMRPLSCAHAAGYTGEGKATKEQFLDFIKRYPSMIPTLKFADEPLRVVEGPDSLLYHTTSAGVRVDGKPYANEYSMLYQFDKESGLIVELVEMIDSAAFLGVLSDSSGAAKE
ncbi:hypothetical protein JCM8097_007310 [Rhodosporidiobolus ruineniae]